MKTTSIRKSFFLFSFLFLYWVQGFSQLNHWTWIKGDNTINQSGVYGTKGIPSVANKPGARCESASWKDAGGNFWLFGGGGYGAGGSWGSFNDLWKYDPSTNEWTWLKGPQLPMGNGVYGAKGIPSANNIPGARQLSASWTDLDGNFWLFGGSGVSNFNDLWKYNTGSNTWTWMNGDNTGNMRGVYGELGLASPTNKPGSRSNAVSWVDQQGDLWLYGGNGYAASGLSGRLGDLWKYSTGNNTWTWVKGDSTTQSLSRYGTRNSSSSSNRPGARMGACGWTDQSGDLWLFGGLGYASFYGVLNDLWKYNIAANEWVWVHGDSTLARPAVYGTTGILNAANKPGAVHNAVTWADKDGNLWLFGGRGYTVPAFGELNSLWKYNIATNQWAFIKGDHSTYGAGEYGVLGIPCEPNKPGSREKPITWTDNLGNLWMFGGDGYPLNTTVTYFHNDLWKFSLVELLPVNLVSFDGKLRDKNILLNWVVENEMNFDHYGIEKSLNGTVFTTIGRVQAMNRRSYAFTDHGVNLARPVYYRLKLTDIDGRFSYSKVINFHSSQEPGFAVYPNPANAYTQLKFNKEMNGKAEIEIVDAAGRLVLKNTITVSGNSIIIPTVNLSPGNYIITTGYNGERAVQNLVIVR